MIRRPPRSTLSSSSAASDVYKRQLPWTALAGLRTGDVSVAAGVLHLPGGHRLPAGPDPASCPPCVWLRWARALGLARREVSIRVLRAALDRAVPLNSASPPRCRIPPGSDRGDDVGDVPGDPVFTPIDQHGYPTLDRTLAPTSLARLTARHLDGCLLYTSDAADEEDSVDLG